MHRPGPGPGPGRRPAAAVLASAALSCAVLAGCASGSSVGDSRLPAAESWSSVAGSPGNRGRSLHDVPADPTLTWSRTLGAPLTGPASSATLGTLFQVTTSAGGCNLYALDAADGRKKWCLRLGTWGPRVVPAVDGRDNAFVPLLGGVGALSDDGEIRWTTAVAGVPTTYSPLDRSRLLVVDHLGVARVLNTHTGLAEGAAAPLAGEVPAPTPDYGVPWCDTGARGCVAPAGAALDAGSSTAYLTVWRPGDGQPELVALHADGGTLSERWRVPLTGGRTGAPVVLSDDGRTAYLHRADGALEAHDTADGRLRWSQPVGHVPDTAPALLPDGTLVLGGRTTTIWRGPDDTHPASAGPAPVVAVRGEGDRVQERWRRDDLTQLTAPVATPDGSVVVAARGPDDAVELLVLSGADGATRWQTRVPGATGPVAGLSVDSSGQITVSTALGEVYLYS